MPGLIPDIPEEILEHESLFKELAGGLRLVTANSRLARVLESQYSEWRCRRNDRQWETPTIQAWEIWISHLWEAASLQGAHGTDCAVPGNQQLISLWQQVLENDQQARSLLHRESLASQLRDTRKRIMDWQLKLDDPAWLGDHNENHAAFHRWNRAFETLCESGAWIAPEDRIPVLRRAVINTDLAAGSEIALLGFDEINPAQSSLLESLRESGVSVRFLRLNAASEAAAIWCAADAEAELRDMACWARYWSEKDPGSSIALVIPDLQSRRQEVERHLAEVLTPGGLAHDGYYKPWNVSLGPPLASDAIISGAFEILSLLEPRPDIQDVGRVLRSPWLRGWHAERSARALLEKRQREKYPRQLRLSEVKYRALETRKFDPEGIELPLDRQEPRPWNCPEFAAIIDRIANFDREHRGTRPASAWAEAINGLLSSLGWPQADKAEGRHQDSMADENHWQASQAWQEALRELASLNASTGEMDRQTALIQLGQICRDRVFQSKSPPAPIQVLGLYEVNGLHFDHMWVLGLQKDNWPPAARPDPFIPGRLQQQARLPHSSPQREVEVARTVTQRLLETSPDIVFSYPEYLEGEKVLASPLLTARELDTVEHTPGWSGKNWPDSLFEERKPVLDRLASPGPISSDPARGGSSILKNQAICPFRAFASNRLGAEGLETPGDGITAMQHGSLLHSVLERFWKETVSQEALLALDRKALDRSVSKHVERVLDEDRGLKFRPAFRDLEARRLQRQAIGFLELEKQRGAFEVIEFEKEIVTEIEGQAIRLVIDRVDRLPSGEEVIIDYKTGKVDPKKWFGDRPEDPQLPLYAISAESTPAGVIFSVIRDDECLYKGVVREAGVFPELPPKATQRTRELAEAGQDLAGTVRGWRSVLHRLMSEFLAGEADIDPREGSGTCVKSYCELQSLCRIGELERLQKSAWLMDEPESAP